MIGLLDIVHRVPKVCQSHKNGLYQVDSPDGYVCLISAGGRLSGALKTAVLDTFCASEMAEFQLAVLDPISDREYWRYIIKLA